ncbi:MAG: hypothetical protein ACP5U1_13130 [Desulfomonilaceae bacterium]
MTMTPAEVLTKIRIAFKNLGLCHQELIVDVGGVFYRISFDPDHFVVYRINHCAGLGHHVPGWPVCLVTEETVFEECAQETLGQDHCYCGFTIEQWLELAKDHAQNISCDSL